MSVSRVFIAGDAAAMAVWVGISRWISARTALPCIAIAPLAIGLVESFWPSFFEWHLGVALWRAWPLVQIAEIGGVAAVSSLLVLINLVLAGFGESALKRRAPRTFHLAGAGIAGIVLALGFARALQVDALQQEAPVADVWIVQPNFGPFTRDERSREGRHLVAALREATREASADGPDLVVWPESAWPYYWNRDLEDDFPNRHPWSLRDRGPAPVLVGALTHPFGSAELYNSAVLLRASGEIAGTYDKRALVPFSEFVPFGEHPAWKDAVERNVPNGLEITVGTGPRVLEEGAMRMGPLICSEDLDSRGSVAAAREGANVLVSMANDGWFEGSMAVYQHLALSMFRAVEVRRSLVRATTNGISGQVDALGRLRLEGPLVALAPAEVGSPTLLRARVPLLEMSSLGSSTISRFPLACALLLGAACVGGGLRTRRRRESRRRERGRRARGRPASNR